MIDEILAKLPEGVFALRDRVAQVLDAIKSGAVADPNPTTRKFTREYLCDALDLPGGEFSLRDRVIDQRRWDTDHELIFRTPELPDGYGWITTYSTGSTEKSDTRPFDDAEEHECTLVKLVPKMTKAWVNATMPEGGK